MNKNRDKQIFINVGSLDELISILSNIFREEKYIEDHGFAMPDNFHDIKYYFLNDKNKEKKLTRDECFPISRLIKVKSYYEIKNFEYRIYHQISNMLGNYAHEIYNNPNKHLVGDYNRKCAVYKPDRIYIDNNVLFIEELKTRTIPLDIKQKKKLNEYIHELMEVFYEDNINIKNIINKTKLIEDRFSKEKSIGLVISYKGYHKFLSEFFTPLKRDKRYNVRFIFYFIPIILLKEDLEIDVDTFWNNMFSEGSIDNYKFYVMEKIKLAEIVY